MVIPDETCSLVKKKKELDENKLYMLPTFSAVFEEHDTDQMKGLR